MGNPSSRLPDARTAKRGAAGSARVRCAIAAVIILVDLADAWLVTSIATTTSHHQLRAIAWAWTVSALAGVLCLGAVILLSWRRRPHGSVIGPRARFGADALLLLAWLKLASVFVALLVLGALTELNGLQLLIIGTVESVAVVWLASGTRRYVTQA